MVRQTQGGIALIIVMISIFVLTMLAAGFAISMRVETKLAQHANNETELTWLGRSGIEYARWVLMLQAMCPIEPYDALNQTWAGGGGGLCATNSGLMDVQREIHLGHGYFTWKITDLDRKWNINVANEMVLQQAFVLMGVDPGQMTPVINSILDWIDPDDNPRIQGAESDYYLNLDPPYEAKNGPIDDITELLLVRGVTPELFWGYASTNHPQGIIQQREQPFGRMQQPPAYDVGLYDLFTPIGGMGLKVNINTTSAAALQLIPGVDARAAEAIVAARGGEDDGSGLTGPFRSTDANYIFTRVPMLTLPLAHQVSQFVVNRSRAFDVEVTAHVAGSDRTFHATLIRNNPKDIQVLNFYWQW